MAALRGSSRLVRSILWNTQHYRQLSCSARIYNVMDNRNADKAKTAMPGSRIEGWRHWFKDSANVEGQSKVLKAESDLRTVQKERRKLQQKMEGVREELKQIVMKLEKVKPGDERYLPYREDEDNIIRHENTLAEEIKPLEERERRLFSELSSAIRESHEEERARNERTKYWWIIAAVTGTLIGTLIGGLGTYISAYLGLKELRRMAKDNRNIAEDLQRDIQKLHADFMQSQSMHGVTDSETEVETEAHDDILGKIKIIALAVGIHCILFKYW